MIRPRGRRLGALFLLTAFLGGGYGLSDLDAVLFHSRPHGVPVDAAHLEQPGGCGAHAEQCVLAVTSARAATAGSATVKVQLNPQVSRTAITAAAIVPSSGRASHHYSRAPPRAPAADRGLPQAV